ncbi:putative rHS repeat-associated core domain protein (plasmid) [Ochrobactrum quorumnocens]|uniref:Putative rHS repeat-associated core domain protein n=1 Tax=Ochrobactrum quorumnocens TaxID=271865 RepID=A0A248UNA1_9HYPH|nr:hypothetical protein [[Ochrobactrum] quorumnocens]ASV88082.1 putative rHS repeat-associated core domain protein [[Ochrobactrum] quorumnocens]
MSSAYASEISCYIIQADGSHIELGIKTYDDCKDAIYAYMNSLGYDERITVLQSAGFGTKMLGNTAIGEAVFLTDWLMNAIDKMDGKPNGFYSRQFFDGYVDSYNIDEAKKLELRANLADSSLSFDEKAQQLEAAGIDIHAMLAASLLGAAAKGGKSWIISVDATGKIPTTWGSGQPNKKGVGTRWQDPNNPGNGVRIDQGNPNHSLPSQREDHVIVRSGGTVIGRDGKPISGSIQDNAEQAHIPLSEYKNWSSWNSP